MEKKSNESRVSFSIRPCIISLVSLLSGTSGKLATGRDASGAQYGSIPPLHSPGPLLMAWRTRTYLDAPSI